MAYKVHIRFKILLIAIALISYFDLYAAYDNTLEPVPTLDYNRLRLIENLSYCHVGYGTQNISFNIEDSFVYSEDASNPYTPAVKPLSNTFLKLGCVFDKIFIDFFLVDDSMKFNETVEYDGKVYNSIKYHYDSLSVGYSFTLIPHLLYADLGLAYSQMQYNLGNYGNSNTNDDFSSETLHNSDFIYHLALKYFFNHYLFAHWQNQKTVDNTSVVYFSNQIGLNFLVRF